MSVHVPRCQLGVTGHRRLERADPIELRARITEVLTLVAGNEGPRCLATSLAEGADRLAAAIALDLGYTLYCPLPFPAAIYEEDFADAQSVAEFRTLLAQAEVVEAQREPGASREAGYTAAGRAVLSASRALLALWDGQPPRGEGGTGQIVAEALERRLPLYWVAVEPPHELRLI